MPPPVNSGIQNLICDISDLVHDVSSLLCGGGGKGGTAQPTQGSSNEGSACVQTVIQHVLNEICGGGNSGNNGSLPVTFTPSGPSSGISDIVCDVKDIAYDIVGLIPSGCDNSPGNFSDVRLKEDIVPLDRLANGLGLYRFRYKGRDEQYVGVMAQEVQQVQPDAVIKGADGFLRVHYGHLGLEFVTWDQWLSRQPN